MRLRGAKPAILLFSALFIVAFKRRCAILETSLPEEMKPVSSPGKNIFSFWKENGPNKNAIIAENDAIHNIRRLKEFQSVTHDILLRHKLDVPHKIEEIETFMSKATNLQPEYWKTALPAIFDPRG